MGAHLVAGLLSPSVTVVETFSDPISTEMFPEEAAYVVRAVESRRREFATVRRCAHSALSELGVEPSPIVPGPHREPLWPSGITGSMTHCDGFRAAAVALKQDMKSLGIDAELNLPLPIGTLELIVTHDERQAIYDLAHAFPNVAWDRLFFSAKESTFKAWFPLTQEWLDFNDCEIDLDAIAGTFVSTLRAAQGYREDRITTKLCGRWRALRSVDGNYLATAVQIPSSRGRDGVAEEITSLGPRSVTFR
jgi:enterobactin synthetase component D / holo-[acyl-carrier protein] synthase